jgi:hypothetical protein
VLQIIWAFITSCNPLSLIVKSLNAIIVDAQGNDLEDVKENEKMFLYRIGLSIVEKS